MAYQLCADIQNICPHSSGGGSINVAPTGHLQPGAPLIIVVGEGPLHISWTSISISCGSIATIVGSHAFRQRVILIASGPRIADLDVHQLGAPHLEP